MNEIFENNKLATRVSNFYNLYRSSIIAIVVIDTYDYFFSPCSCPDKQIK